MVVVDTSIIIDHLRQQDRPHSKLAELIAKFPDETWTISMITVQELYTGKSAATAKNEIIIIETIQPFEILEYSKAVAKTAGALVRENKSLTFADAAIAATAIKNHASIATINQKDFEKIPGLTLLQLH